MKRLVLIGSKKYTLPYVKKFIEDNYIPVFNIMQFTERLKISDVRLLKRRLAVKSTQGNRVVILENGIMPEAQHALLKSIEELPEDTNLMILVEQKEQLLSTIISRCNLIVLRDDVGEKEEAPPFEPEIQAYIDAHTLHQYLQASFKLSAQLSSEEDFSHALQSLRQAMLGEILNGNVTSAQFMARVITEYLKIHSFMQTNNLNKQLSLDTFLMRLSLSRTRNGS